jgi:L-amino acid N-acyltransferase YncA
MIIRVAEDRDAEAIAAIYAPIVTSTTISFETEPPSADEMKRRVRETLTHYPWLVADDGEVLGYAYATQHRARVAYRFAVDVSVYIGERARRRGVGRRLYSELFSILERQGFVAAHAGIALPNEASVALHESLGFTPIGVYGGVGYKLGKWLDVGWWQRPLAARGRQPTEPIPFEP